VVTYINESISASRKERGLVHVDFLHTIVTILSSALIPILLSQFLVILHKRERKRALHERLDFTRQDLNETMSKLAEYPEFLTTFWGEHSYNPVFYDENSNTPDYNEKSLIHIYAIFSAFDKISLAVENGIYDEVYTRIAIGNNMRLVYKRYSYLIRKMRMSDDELFLPTELLLSKWYSSKNTTMSFSSTKKGRRMT